MSTFHPEMHADHRLWLSDDAMWRDDLAIWEHEVGKALEDLKELEEALRDHREALREHLETIGAEERAVHYHEGALAEYEAGGSGRVLMGTAPMHEDQAGRHALRRLTHEKLKRHHHTVMAHWGLLFQALTEKP